MENEMWGNKIQTPLGEAIKLGMSPIKDGVCYLVNLIETGEMYSYNSNTKEMKKVESKQHL